LTDKAGVLLSMFILISARWEDKHTCSLCQGTGRQPGVIDVEEYPRVVERVDTPEGCYSGNTKDNWSGDSLNRRSVENCTR
jgi:hypothetical protein